MIKFIALIVVLFAAALAGCATLPTPTVQTPAQVAVQICPSLQSVASVLSVPGAIDPSDAATMERAAPVITAVCAAPAAATPQTLASLQNDAAPLLLKAISAAPNLSARQKQDAILGIALAQAAIAPVIAQIAAHEADESSAPAAASTVK